MNRFVCFCPVVNIQCFGYPLSIETFMAHLAALSEMLLSTLQFCTTCANCVSDWPDVCTSCNGCRKLRTACRPSRASFQNTFTVTHAKLLSKILKRLVPRNLILVSLRCCNKNIRIIVVTLNSKGKLLKLQLCIWEVLGVSPETRLANCDVCGFH